LKPFDDARVVEGLWISSSLRRKISVTLTAAALSHGRCLAQQEGSMRSWFRPVPPPG